MKVKSIKTVEVKEIGAINLNNIEAVNGNLTRKIMVDAISVEKNFCIQK